MKKLLRNLIRELYQAQIKANYAYEMGCLISAEFTPTPEPAFLLVFKKFNIDVQRANEYLDIMDIWANLFVFYYPKQNIRKYPWGETSLDVKNVWRAGFWVLADAMKDCDIEIRLPRIILNLN